MKAKPAKARKGIKVHIPNAASPLTFADATGWGIDNNGILAIGVPSGRFNEAGQALNDTVASFKSWDSVGWA